MNSRNVKASRPSSICTKFQAPTVFWHSVSRLEFGKGVLDCIREQGIPNVGLSAMVQSAGGTSPAGHPQNLPLSSSLEVSSRDKDLG